MRLTLCLPGALLPRQALRDTISGLKLPALSLLTGRGRLRRDTAGTYHDWLARRWNLEMLPAAALRLLGEGGTPAGHEWLCLDPVHLSVHRRGVRLADPAALALSADEDAQLRETLAPLFADLGELQPTFPGHWHLRLDRAGELITLALPDAIGKDVDPALPGGREGVPWRRRLAEAQTLLHDHAVNRARDKAAKPLLNSLWPWGGGSIAPSSAACNAVWSADPVALGLARASGIAAGAPPVRFEHASGEVLAVLDDLAAPARNFDALAWRDALMRLEQDWLAPALDALRRGRCAALRVVAFGAGASLDVGMARSDLLKIWRRPLPPVRLAA